MNLKALKIELETDPLGRGYSSMTDTEAANDLNTAYRSRIKARLDQTDLYNSIDQSEFDALGSTAQEEIWKLLHIGGSAGLLVSNGSLARKKLISTYINTSFCNHYIDTPILRIIDIIYKINFLIY